MKPVILIVSVLTLLVGGIWSWNHLHKSRSPVADARPEPSPVGVAQTKLADKPVAPSLATAPPAASPRVSPAAAPEPRSPNVKPAATAQQEFEHLLNTVANRHANFAEKQQAWQQLKDGGLLDETITQLERIAQDDPANPTIPASLGQAYLYKASTLSNSIAQQGICGLKADSSFDAALTLDPNNWEARFWKATAMAHWPAVLDKSREVMQHFVTLIEQQESQPPQPQFAQTYLWLGKEYLKNGYPEYAQQVWQRGLTLFPDQADLQTQLASLSQP